MTPVRVFRALVILELVFLTASWSLIFWEDNAVAFSASLWAFFGLVWMVLIAISIGVFLFNPIARLLYVASVPAFIAVNFWFHGSITTNNESLFDHLSTLCTGGILALMWFNPGVTQGFRKKQSNPRFENDAIRRPAPHGASQPER
jgi:hypothetical protein